MADQKKTTEDAALAPLPEMDGSMEIGKYDTDFQRTEMALTSMIEDIGVQPHELARIEIPGGKNTKFLLPGLSPEPDSVPEVVGVIVTVRPVHFYYEGEYTGDGGNRPTCSSYLVARDGGKRVVERGRGEPGGWCDECPKNVFGPNSEPPECKQKQAVYLWIEGAIAPYLLLIPPTGLKNMRNYMLRLLSNGLNPYNVVTRFTLIQDRNNAGQVYPRVAPPEVVEVLKDEKLDNVQAYVKKVSPWLRTAIVEDEGPREQKPKGDEPPF